MDKRGRKTLKSIETAFNQLLLEKSFDVITVTDICDTADISRKTSYTYYADKYELIDSLASESLTDLDELSHGDANVPTETRIAIWFNYVQEHKKLLYVLFTTDSSYSFRLKFLQYLMDSLSKHGAFSKNTINLQFYAHGVLGVVEAFVSDKIQATPEEIAKDLEKKIPMQDM